MKWYQCLGLGLLSLFCSCHPEDENINISKAGMMSLPFTEAKEESITFIYQYNHQRSNLEWTAVKIARSSGDDLKDALTALLENFQRNGICQGLSLEQLTRENNQSVIHFSGKPMLKSTQDSTIFWSAIELTTNRYDKKKGYKVIFE